MSEKDDELDRLEELAESFSSMGDFTQLMRDSYSRLESKFEDVNSRLARVNELLRQSLAERNRLANYLNNILESTDSGIIVTDQSGTINIFNSAAEKLTGIRAGEALGKGYKDVFLETLSPETEKVFDGISQSISGEKRYISIDGTERPVAFSISRLKQYDGEQMSGVVEILYDLTEIKRLENNLKRVSTLAALGEMAATVAHEIRNPLAGISGFTALLLRDLDPQDRNLRTVKKISNGVESLNTIVGSLLDFTRPVSPNSVEVDPVSLIEDTISNFKVDSESSNHEFEIVRETKRLRVKLDPDLFRQIIYNLTRNAVQTCPEGGSVRLVLADSDSRGLVLRVEDNGPGIPDDIRNKLFTPFFTTKTNGIGLGLATVKKLAELHGGRVTAGNRSGGGAVFTVEIPRI